MGDLRAVENGAVLEHTLVLSPGPGPGPDPFGVGEELWVRAEAATREIIRQVQPTGVSDERRRGVIDYVQRILKGYLGCEVFPFGSVPLKTYLPDGDIDLTAFGGFTIDEQLANGVYAVLEAEDHNPCAEFIVKDVQYICAEVKLVKCLVQNIVVDISFNQLGGLCTLCFLEEVDRLIGKDYLFKRSIILIKAWCYYESRILGAHHGLISTYALETLVLYIFHLFHSSLNGPLAVLYKFLDYFSKFDWEKFCVSLNGPVHVSSLPEIVAERPENGSSDLLLSDDFLRECMKKFSVPSRGTETNSRSFIQKHLNIVDPLKENNNLGRSVSKGNFFRIRSAFAFGARKLGRILSQPEDNVAEEVRRFFTNTLERHGTGQRPDVQEPGFNGFAQLSLSGAVPGQADNSVHEVESFNSCDGSGNCGEVIECNSGDLASDIERVCNGQQSGFKKSDSDEISESRYHLSGYRKDLAISGIEALRISDHADERKLPHRDFSGPLENGKMGNQANHSSTDSNPCSELTSLDQERDLTCLKYCSYSPKPLQDLSGDFEAHLVNLRYGRWWFDQVSSTPIQSVHLPLQQASLFPRKSPWDAIRHTVQFRTNPVRHMNANGVVPAFFPVVPGVAFGGEEMPKPRGTGMYFPITNHNSYRDRSSLPKGRTQAPLKSPRSDKSSESQSSFRHAGGRPRSSDPHESSPRGKPYGEFNGDAHDHKREAQFGSARRLPFEDPSPESSSQSSSVPSPRPGQRGNPILLPVHTYRLKDEDFPPLSV